MSDRELLVYVDLASVAHFVGRYGRAERATAKAQLLNMMLNGLPVRRASRWNRL